VAPASAAPEKLILGKFKTNEDVIKAYQELEKKLGQPRDTKAPDKEPVKADAKAPAKEADKAPAKEGTADKKVTEDKAPTDDAEKVITEAGLDFNKYSEEFTAKGELAPETIDEIVKGTKVPREVVDNYLRGLKAIAAQDAMELTAAVGGQAQVDNVLGWARENLPKEELEAFDASCKGAPKAQQVLAFKGLQARMEGVEGKTPKLVAGRTGQGDHGGYNSDAEWLAAVNNPLFQAQTHAGAAYRAQVQDKLAKMMKANKR
jgi:hypothetical protein